MVSKGLPTHRKTSVSTNKPVTKLQRPKGKCGGPGGGRLFTWALRPGRCLPRQRRAGRPFWGDAAAGKAWKHLGPACVGLGGGARRREAQGAAPVGLAEDPLRPDEELPPGDRIHALGELPAAVRRIGGRQDPSRRQARDSCDTVKGIS